MIAAVHAMTDLGYEALTVEAIAQRAGLAPSDFQAHFANVQEVVGEAFDFVFENYMQQLLLACETQSEWAFKVKVAIGVSLDLAAAAPAEAQFLILEALGANRGIARRALNARDRLVSLLAKGREHSPHGSGLPPLTEQVVIAGLVGALSTRLATGEANRLPELAPELVELTLLFYLDPEEATRVARRPKPV